METYVFTTFVTHCRTKNGHVYKLGLFINQSDKKCRKLAKVAEMVSVRVVIKVKISIFGDAANWQ